MSGSPLFFPPLRSGRENIAGCVWLPRMLQKARAVASQRSKAYGEAFGKADPCDGQLLDFLGLSEERVVQLSAAEPDDERAARAILYASGRSPEETIRWSMRFLQKLGRER